MKSTLEQLDIRGLQTSFLETNRSAKETILFLHGFPDSAHAWDGLIEKLGKNYHCIAPFARGLNESPHNNQKDRLTLDSQMLDLLEILRATGAMQKNIHILSHDLGAVPAWKLSHLLGKKAESLTVINGLSLKQFLRRLKNPHQLIKSWYIWLLQVPGIMETFMKKNPDYILKKAATMGGRDLKTFDREALKGFELYRQYLKETPTEIKSSTRIKAKVLSINSAEDAFLLPTTLEELERDCENCEARILQGKHWIHHENPELVAGIISNFIGSKNAKSKFTIEMGL